MKWIITVVIFMALLPLVDQPKKPAHAVQINNSVQAQPEQQVTTKAKPTPTVQAPSPQPEPVPIQPQQADNRTIGMQMAAEKGWTGDQWLCLEKLWSNESNWRHTVANYQGSGAYGIAQALPASKMASHGEDYLTNPRTQIAWGLDYIASRYQTPCNALSFWNSRYPHWY